MALSNAYGFSAHTGIEKARIVDSGGCCKQFANRVERESFAVITGRRCS